MATLWLWQQSRVVLSRQTLIWHVNGLRGKRFLEVLGRVKSLSVSSPVPVPILPDKWQEQGGCLPTASPAPSVAEYFSPCQSAETRADS